MGVQIEFITFAELVEMAAYMRLSPSQALKLAFRALASELATGKPARVGRLVGKRGGCWKRRGATDQRLRRGT
jgi:hypothetical protein